MNDKFRELKKSCKSDLEKGSLYGQLQVTQSLLHILSIAESTQEFLDKLVELIRQACQCQAAGIRVLQGNGYLPYQAYSGYACEFMAAENQVHIRSAECTCTRLVRGELLPCEQDMTTPAGSLWINDTDLFAKRLAKSERSMFRGACVKAGYGSAVFVPIACQSAVLGLIQVVDERANRFNPAMTELLESIGLLAGKVIQEDKKKSWQSISPLSPAVWAGVAGSSLACVIDRDTLTLIYSSKQLDELWGKSMLGRSCYEILGSSSPCPDCHIRQAQRPESHFGSWEWERHDAVNDRYYLFELKTVTLPNDKTRDAILVTDISQQKLAEKKLCDSETERAQMTRQLQRLGKLLKAEAAARQTAQAELCKLRLFFVHSQDSLFLLDPQDGRIMEANPAAEYNYGYTRAELVTMNIGALHLEQQQESITARLSVAAKGGITFDSIHRCKHNTLFPVRVNLYSERIGIKQVVIGVVRKLAEFEPERRQLHPAQAEATYRLAHTAAFRGALAAFAAAVIQPDITSGELYQLVLEQAKLLTGSTQGCIALVDDSAGGGFGPGRAETGAFYTNNPEPQALINEVFGSALPGENVLIVPAICKDVLLGHIILAASARGYTAAELEAVQQLGRIFASALWTRKREGQLQAARNSAEAAARAKTEFLANMSHEVRTPMTGILISSELLLAKSLPAEIAEQVRDIHASAKSLVTILDDVLDFVRLEADVIRIEEKVFSLPDLIRSTSLLIKAKARAKGLALETSIAPNLPAWVVGDSVRIRQVLTNLLDNAVKFTAAGQVVLEVAQAAGQAGGTPLITFSVSDTGPGIRPENQELIFERFYQIDAAAAKHHGGIGLGLSIVKLLVEKMGGKLSCSSNMGQGSTFSFSLPLQPGSLSKDSAAGWSLAEAVVKGLRVLLVEDNEMNRRVVAQLLAQMGADADVAVDGRDALSKLKNKKYDVVLMDIQMPGLDGYETVRLLRRSPATANNRDVYIVALTAGALADERERCLKAGMNDYLVKPFTALQLYQLLTGTTACPPGNEIRPDIVFDPAALLAYVGNDRTAFQECIRRFPQTIGPLLTELSAAIGAGQWREGKRLAHIIKGAAGNFAAPRLQQAAIGLEKSLQTADGHYNDKLQAVVAEYHYLIDKIYKEQ